MIAAVEQSATFKASPNQLFELFMDSAKHTAATGGMPAKISRKIGGKWSAFGGMVFGRNIEIVPNRMIVQTWRSSEWKKEDPDSILIVRFQEASRSKTTVELTHVGVPKYDLKGVRNGWPKYYWEPWKRYLKAQKF